MSLIPTGTKRFILSIIDFYGMETVVYHAARNTEYYSTDIAGGPLARAAWFPLEDLQLISARNVVWDLAKSTAKRHTSTYFKGSPRRAADAVCRSVIADRKRIEQDIREQARGEIPAAVVVLQSADKIRIIRRLMTYDSIEFISLQETVSIQLCHMFFRLESIIRVKSKLEAADEKKLLAELGKLIERLGITDRYAKLFAPSIRPRCDRLSAPRPGQHCGRLHLTLLF